MVHETLCNGPEASTEWTSENVMDWLTDYWSISQSVTPLTNEVGVRDTYERRHVLMIYWFMYDVSMILVSLIHVSKMHVFMTFIYYLLCPKTKCKKLWSPPEDQSWINSRMKWPFPDYSSEGLCSLCSSSSSRSVWFHWATTHRLLFSPFFSWIYFQNCFRFSRFSHLFK